MPKDYTKEELKKPKEVIPSDVLEALFSEETPFKISEICIKNGVEEEEKIEEISHQVGLVLLGKLPPNELRGVFEKEIKLDPLTAMKVVQEIDRTIFLPIKSSLEEIYKIEIKPPAGLPPIKPPEIAWPEEKPPALPGKDVYREPIE